MALPRDRKMQIGRSGNAGRRHRRRSAQLRRVVKFNTVFNQQPTGNRQLLT